MKGIIVIQLVFLGLIFGLVAEKPSRDSDVLKSSRSDSDDDIPEEDKKRVKRGLKSYITDIIFKGA